MLFNSIHFAVFLPVVFVLYWFVAGRNLKLQNALIAAASCFFYACWDWRFLFLILLGTIVDYSIGIALSKQESVIKRKALLWLSLGVNLGLLGFFKYCNFFLENLVAVSSFIGFDIKAQLLNVILPVGISFYTFQRLTYTIDVYKRKLEPTRDFLAFTAFVCFFPQLLAGPIERAANMLPQFMAKRTFDHSAAADGLRQMLWGLFKKIVIADTLAEYLNVVFGNYGGCSGSTLVLGALFYTIQIYADFSGYSDIAIGTARLLGIRLMKNFAFPYFSRDIAEFWRRWHISLTSWFRDYLYIPLGGNKGGMVMRIRNVIVVFIVSGFWHGANWTFIAWGALHAMYYLPLIVTGRNRLHVDTVAAGRILPSMRDFFSMLLTFGMTALAWIFFRAKSIGDAVNYISGIFSMSFFTAPRFEVKESLPMTILFIVVFTIMEWRGRERHHALEGLGMQWKRPLRWAMYYGFIIVIFLYAGKEQQFIYFQF